MGDQVDERISRKDGIGDLLVLSEQAKRRSAVLGVISYVGVVLVWAVGAFMILAWMTQVLDHGIAGIIGCFLFWALGIARFDLAFGGFASDSTWFVFGALLLGAVATRSGVARRLAYLVILRIGTSYSRILLGLIVTNFLLTFLVPSGLARVVIMASIATSEKATATADGSSRSNSSTSLSEVSGRKYTVVKLIDATAVVSSR